MDIEGKFHINGKPEYYQYQYVIVTLYRIHCVCSLQVWAKGAKPSNAGESDTECKESSWGIGANITTKLVNPAGEVRHCDMQQFS